MKKHLVTLTEAERAALGQRVHSGLGPARELARARILLKADRGPHGPGWTDATIASALDVSCSTVERVRRRFAGPAGKPRSVGSHRAGSIDASSTGSRRPA